jgi:hypothetical protein
MVLVGVGSLIMALSSLLVHRKLLPCPLLKMLTPLRRWTKEWSVGKLDDLQLISIAAQHIYGIAIVAIAILHYLVLINDGLTCSKAGSCSVGITDESAGHIAYHHAAFHQIMLMILSETLRFRFVQLAIVSGLLSLLAVVAIAIGGDEAFGWACGWIVLNMVLGLLLSRSNERRRRSDFFLGYVSDEGSKETLNMLYAMLPQAIAKPLLSSVSV